MNNLATIGIHSDSNGRTVMSSPLDNISIAAPCSVGWDSMSGTDTIRFCNQCSKNVYDISAMSQSEAEKFLSAQENLPCLKMFRRADGTIIFDNCPVGLRRIRNHAKAVLKFVSSIAAALMSVPTALAKDEVRPECAGARVNWTLVENGHTERNPYIPGTVQGKPLAQLGVPCSNPFFPQGWNVPLTSGLSGNGAFVQAIKFAAAGKITMAEIEFQKALFEAKATNADPNLTEFIASEYAKLLRKKGDSKGAEKLLSEYKVPGVKTVIVGAQ